MPAPKKPSNSAPPPPPAGGKGHVPVGTGSAGPTTVTLSGGAQPGKNGPVKGKDANSTMC
jgi:hypothetical protein